MLTLTIDRIGGSIGAASIDFFTALGSADAAGLGGALRAGTLAFADGHTSRTVTIEIARDTAVKADETIVLTLTNPTSGAAIGDGTATGRD